MKGKFRAVAQLGLALVLALSLSLVTAVPAGAAGVTHNVIPADLTASTSNATAEWSTTQAYSGSSSVHLQTTGTLGSGHEARIRITMPAGTTLDDITFVSWREYLVAGYPPHLDIKIDKDGNGTEDDALVFEYAYNSETHASAGQPTYGALNDAWYQTFSDDGNGPAEITDTANAWLSSGPPGPLDDPSFIYGTLAEWKAGIVSASANGTTPVIALEIEVDNWIAQTEAYVDGIAITVGGSKYYVSVQDAIDSATSGDTISVTAGTYEEDLSIPDTKTGLELAGADGAIIKGVAMTDSSLFPLAAPNIDILSDNVSIHGFTIKGPDPIAGYYSSGMVIGGSSVEIYSNAFQVTNSANTTLYDVSQGIQTYHKLAVPGVDVSGLNIHDNTFTHLGAGTAGFEAIYINLDEGTGTANITNNQFTGYVVRGITTERSNTTISGNSIITDVATSVALQGINVQDPAGTPSAQDAVSITANTIKGSGTGKGFAQGIRIGNTAGTQTLTNISVTQNTVQLNTVGIRVRSSANGVVVNHNNIEDNTTFGVENTNTANTLDAQNNWWGNASRPVPDTLPAIGHQSYGDKVSDNVDYKPWLLAEVEDGVTPTTYEKTLALKDGWTLVSSDKEVTTGTTWVGTGVLVLPDTTILAYKYTAGSGYAVIDLATQLKSVDAFYVKTDEGGGVGINYSTDAPGVVTKNLAEGWNIISAAGEPDAYTLLSQLRYVQIGEQQGAGITNLIGQANYNQFTATTISVPLATGTDWTALSGSSETLNAFDGYWVYMNAAKTFGVIPD